MARHLLRSHRNKKRAELLSPVPLPPWDGGVGTQGGRYALCG